MIQTYLTFITAISLSGIAAFYSVIGLAQIFPGSFWPIVIMGSVLEIAKLVTVSWLYNNWHDTARWMRFYFSIAVVILMLITSMGIFGFLSKAHIETNVVSNDNTVQLRTIEQQETIVKNRLNYLLKKAGDDPSKISRNTDKDIRAAQQELAELNKQKLPLLKEENKLSAEIGPIKYIAELIYGKTDTDVIDKAVRIVILMIIIVFDPLAILLLIAFNQSYRRKETLDTRYDSDIQSYIKVPKKDVFEMK
jgi:hypothetical protein